MEENCLEFNFVYFNFRNSIKNIKWQVSPFDIKIIFKKIFLK